MSNAHEHFCICSPHQSLYLLCDLFCVFVHVFLSCTVASAARRRSHRPDACSPHEHVCVSYRVLQGSRTLSKQELAALSEEHRFDPLPEGYTFDGTL